MRDFFLFQFVFSLSLLDLLMATGELHRVFVYGTLKHGLRNHHMMLNSSPPARLLSYARTLTPFPLVVERFPYVLGDLVGKGSPNFGSVLIPCL